MFGSLVIFVSGEFLPSPTEVDPRIIAGSPIQEDFSGDLPPVVSSVGKITYRFFPRATYEISGVVVSLHHSDSFIDITHTYDPANTLDLCLVWGENVATDAYRKVEYSHGDFTCFYRWTGEDPGFRGDEMSNSHIVPATETIARLANRVRVGDQVVMRGRLVDYETSYSNGETIGRRNTSLTREDTGNGACEIIYLDDLRTIKRSAPWRVPTFWMLLLGGAVAEVLALVILMRRYAVVRPASAVRSESSRPENPMDPRNYPRTREDMPTPQDRSLAE